MAAFSVSTSASSTSSSSTATSFHVFIVLTTLLVLLQQVCRVRSTRFDLGNETLQLNSLMNIYEEAAKDSISVTEDSSNNVGSLQSPDFYERKAVQIGSVVIKPMENVDKSWPPANAHEFSRIDITVMGKRVDGATLHNLVPDLTKMKTRELRKLLEPNFNTKWMSITKPNILTAQEKMNDPFEMDPKLTQRVDEFNFTFEDELGTSFVPNSNMVHMFKSWLLRQASCPLEYLWEDLGILFWPRWIKRGMCSMSYSCSWPPGMQCKSSGSRSIKVLRWVCTEEERQDRQTRRSAQQNMSPQRAKTRLDESRQATTNRGNSRRVKAKKRRPGERRLGRKRRRNKITTVKEMMTIGDEGEKRSSWEFRKERRQIRKRRRLMKKLSLRVGSYTCQWMIAEYPVIDKCSCMCT